MITLIEKKHEIEREMLSELASIGLVDPSPDNVLAALEGLLDSWREDESAHPEKQHWMTALEWLIVDYKIKVFVAEH